jgi:hypothetical protein
MGFNLKFIETKEAGNFSINPYLLKKSLSSVSNEETFDLYC